MPDFAPLTSRGSLPGLDTFIVLNVLKIRNILEVFSLVLTMQDPARHLCICSVASKFLCASCDKSFTKSRSLKKRTLTQDPEQQFKCHHCSKRFMQKVI